MRGYPQVSLHTPQYPLYHFIVLTSTSPAAAPADDVGGVRRLLGARQRGALQDPRAQAGAQPPGRQQGDV